MNTYLVLSIISDDKPGVIESLSQTIAEQGGNRLESRMAHLAGKFAGILRISINSDQQALEAAPVRSPNKVLRHCHHRL